MTSNTTPDNHEAKPHSPDVAERETQDDGFASGLGFFFQPSEAYWFDSHTHLRGVSATDEISAVLDDWFSRLDAFRLGRLLAIVDDKEMIPACGEVAARDPRFSWIYWLEPDQPDVELLRESFRHGAIGLKLHNKVIMSGDHPHEIWLSDEWAEVFQELQEAGKPILWHVTQRHSASPYHGGGEYSYWKEGWEKGVDFTNEDLLQITLEIMRRFPDLKVQGAHSLHVGPERLASLFDEFENLYVDTSCAWFVRWADTLYDQDRERLRDFALRYSDRILFGSDAGLSPETIDEYLVQGFLCHARCINQLRLPHEALQMISHENAEGLYGLKAIDASRRGNYRP